MEWRALFANIIQCGSQGYNNKGQLGDGALINRPVPIAVTVANTWTSIAAGTALTCAITSAGKPFCWGGNGGQLGDGTATDRTVPTQIASAVSWSSLALGSVTTCGISGTAPALNSLGAAPPAPPLPMAPTCWGTNSQGHWGVGTVTGTSYTANSMATASVWRQLSMTSTSQCGILAASSALYCWGTDGSYGFMGDGTLTTHTAPSTVAGGGQWKTVFASTSLVGFVLLPCRVCITLTDPE